MAEVKDVNKEGIEKPAELLEELPISKYGRILLQKTMEISSDAPSELKATIAAIAYRQLMKMEEPILFNEVCKITGAEVKEAKDEFRNLYRREKIRIANRQRLLERYARKYGDKIIDIYEQFKEVLDRHSPEVAVAVCIYLSDYLGPLTQKEVANELNVAESSIKNVLRELKLNLPIYLHRQSKTVRDIERYDRNPQVKD